MAADDDRAEREAFLAIHHRALEQYAAFRDESKAVAFLGTPQGLPLLSGVAHVEAWFLARHVNMMARGKSKPVEAESKCFFLLGAASDAAGHVYASHHDIDKAAREGVLMLSNGLKAKGDPARLRTTIAERSKQWVSLVKHLNRPIC